MYNQRYDRNIGVWTEEFQVKLKNITVGIAGLGGSGSCLVSLLTRNGFGCLKIADPGIFDIFDIQRQLFATEKNLGKNKTLVTEEEVRYINPEIKVISYKEGIKEGNLENFLEGCDFVHEVMDYSVPALKILFHRKAREKKIITTTSAVIAGGVATFVFHPEGMSFEEYFEYPGNITGWNLSHQKLVKKDPDYLLKEFFLNRVKQGTIPSTADGAFLTAITTVGIYKRLLMGKEVAYVPKIMRFDILDDSMYLQTIID